jgi:retinol dehydrogenase-12
MAEMREKKCIVTGATSGIGYEVSLALALQGARVIGVGRDAERCAAAEKRIWETTGNDGVSFEVADLSSQAEIRSLTARLGTRLDRVDVLVNNAGIFTLSRRDSADGVEMQLAVNWLAGFMLTGLLLPLLRAAPRARIIALSSGSHFSGRIRWDDIGLRRGYSGLKAYTQSKLATVLFTYELARRLGPGSPISVYAVDPGLVKTEIGLKGTGPIARMVWTIRIRRGMPARQSAQAVVFLAADSMAEEMTGLYWKEKKPLPSSKSANDPAAARRLWNMGEEMCGVRYP